MTNSHFQGDVRPPRLFIAIALILALLGVRGLESFCLSCAMKWVG